jgi:hypothetical protein
MDRKETQQQRVTRVAQELGVAIRRQARGRWKQVRTAERNEPGRHVWRFIESPEGEARFLHVEHKAMTHGADASGRLLGQLEAEGWLDRLQQGPETALLLSKDGQLSPYQKR